MNSSNPIRAQLSAAINAGDLVHLHTILLQKKGKRHIVTDHFLHYALYETTQKGSVESCRLLWERLSEDGKGKYFADKSINDAISGSLLHTAVIFGQLKVVRFIIEECNFNINQKDRIGRTPLFYARCSVELTGYLLEHGADVNLYKGTLTYAVETRRTEIVRLLLRHGAVPNRECFHRAIHRGNAEILSILLEHHPLAADLEHHKPDFGPTILNRFLMSGDVPTETKLSISRILIEHGSASSTAVSFMHRSLEYAVTVKRVVCCEILLQAGVRPSRRALDCSIQNGREQVCRLLVQYGADPFSEEGDENENENENHAASPFVAAARLSDTGIFEYFLTVWNERFASTAGKNGDGDYPLHVACCDPRVSLQAIQVLVNHQPDALAVVDGEEGILPFHFAANWGASLDVIFYLLQHCPDALSHGSGNAAATGAHCQLTTAVDERNGSKVESLLESTCHDDVGQVKKKARTTTSISKM